MSVPLPVVPDIIMEDSKHPSNEQNIHTPPASDMSSHGRKDDDDDDDDDVASSSELSDLDDQFEGAPQPSFAQDLPMPDAPAIVEPDRYEGGIPIFQPVRFNWICMCQLILFCDDCAFLSALIDVHSTDRVIFHRLWTSSRISKST